MFFPLTYILPLIRQYPMVPSYTILLIEEKKLLTTLTSVNRRPSSRRQGGMNFNCNDYCKKCSNCSSPKDAVKHQSVRDLSSQKQHNERIFRVRKHAAHNQSWQTKSFVKLVNKVCNWIMKRRYRQIYYFVSRMPVLIYFIY